MSFLTVAQGILDAGSDIYGIINNERNFKYQKEIDAFNKDMAEKNYQLAVDQMNWQQKAQQTAWDREDTAIARRVADLQSQGMSKWLAAGQGAQSGGVTASNVNNAGNLINSGANLKDITFKNGFDSFLAGVERESDISLTRTQEEATKAEIDNIKSQTVRNLLGLNKDMAEIDYISSLTDAKIDEIKRLNNQFIEQTKLWEGERKKNSAAAMQARQSAELLQIEAQMKLKELNQMESYYNLSLREGEERIKNSTNERKNRTANTVNNFLNTGLKGIEVLKGFAY